MKSLVGLQGSYLWKAISEFAYVSLSSTCLFTARPFLFVTGSRSSLRYPQGRDASRDYVGDRYNDQPQMRGARPDMQSYAGSGNTYQYQGGSARPEIQKYSAYGRMREVGNRPARVSQDVDHGRELGGVATECPMGCGFLGTMDLVQVRL